LVLVFIKQNQDKFQTSARLLKLKIEVKTWALLNGQSRPSNGLGFDKIFGLPGGLQKMFYDVPAFIDLPYCLTLLLGIPGVTY
jgi:hypothetical protein